MIIKGGAHTGKGLGTYLMQDKNDRAEVLGIRGDLSRPLGETLDDWRSDSLTTQCSKPLYHAQLNPDRALSREEWETAINLFEKEMGFENQPRAVVLHEYKGREHMHLVYSRIDENGKAISDSWNYLHHEKAARAIEQELGLEKTQGALYDRQAQRPERTPDRDAIQQGERLNLSPKAIKAQISELYRSADSGRAFVAALEESGYTLAQGDKRGFAILDPAGGVHSLSRMAGAKASDLRERLAECDLQQLPSVEQARTAQQERNAEREPEAAREHGRQAPEIERQPEAAQTEPAHEAPTREQEHMPEANAAEIDHAATGPELDDLGEGMERGAGSAAGAIGDTAAKLLSGVLGLFDSPAPPTKAERIEQAERIEDSREARIAAAAERLRLVNEAYRKQQEQEREKDNSRGRERGRERSLWGE